MNREMKLLAGELEAEQKSGTFVERAIDLWID
jgi:hypothetical protein